MEKRARRLLLNRSYLSIILRERLSNDAVHIYPTLHDISIVKMYSGLPEIPYREYGKDIRFILMNNMIKLKK